MADEMETDKSGDRDLPERPTLAGRTVKIRDLLERIVLLWFRLDAKKQLRIAIVLQRLISDKTLVPGKMLFKD